MKTEIRAYLLRAAGMVLVCWILSILFVSFIYPPRRTVSGDYIFVILVGLSCAPLARPSVPWRYALYYAFFAGLPEVVSVIGTYGTNFMLQGRSGQKPSATMVLLPLGRILLLLAVTAGVMGFAATHLKSRLAREQHAGQVSSEVAPNEPPA